MSFFLKASQDLEASKTTDATYNFKPNGVYTRCYKSIDDTITITLDVTGKKIASIEDSSDHFSDSFLEFHLCPCLLFQFRSAKKDSSINSSYKRHTVKAF